MLSLVVDDSPIIQILLQHILAPYGKCDVAQNGQEAIDAHSRSLADGRPYDLICLDLGLPYFDGLTVLSKIRAAEAQRQLPGKARIVVVTATREPGRVQKASELGADACLLKPVVAEELIQHLKDFGLVGDDDEAKAYGALVRQTQRMCDADEIPVAVLARMIRSMANSIDRQSSDSTPTATERLAAPLLFIERLRPKP
jgi:two-component system chemotaxis response regulator CheY